MKKILSTVLAIITFFSIIAISSSATGTLIFRDDFEMGFKPLNWIQGDACEFKWDSTKRCLAGYYDAVTLQPNYSSRSPKMWDQFYASYDFQVRGFDDIDGKREYHDVGIWYRDLFENNSYNSDQQKGAIYTMWIRIETGLVIIKKEHSFNYRDEYNILQEYKFETVLLETMLPGAEKLEADQYAIEIGQDAPWHEIGMRVTSGKIEWYYDHQLLATTIADPDDEKVGDFALNSIDSTVGSQKSPVIFWNGGNYIAVDNFEVWSPDYNPGCPHTVTENIGAVSPDCNKEGCTGDTVCVDCGVILEYSKTIPQTNNHILLHHDGLAPTCTEAGYAEYDTCEKCDYTTFVDLPATGHSIVQHSAKVANCTEKGWLAYEDCKNCDYTTYVELRAYGHQYENNICIHCGEAKPVLPGDVNGNGVIDITDLSAFRRFIGGAVVTGFNEAASDVDGDGEVKISDVSVLARIIAGAVI